jgi:hypothetical protein
MLEAPMNRIAVAGLVAVAVALVTVPVAVVASDRLDRSSAPRPTDEATWPPTQPTEAPETSSGPAPSPTSPATERPDPFTPASYDAWLVTIPPEVTVSAGLPADGGDYQRSTGAVTESFCGADGLPVAGVLDTRRNGMVGPEFADLRDLRLYADDAAAHDLLVRVREAAEGCPEDEHGRTRWLTDVTGPDLGEEAVRVVRTYETDGLVNLGATFWHVVRVGNAVLVTAQSGEYLPGDTLGQGIESHERTIAPIIARLCEFGASGCAAAGDIPDDVPLAAGWPDDDAAEPGPRYGLRGPDRSLGPLTWTLCEESFTASGERDRLRADWHNVEDYRGRELLTFDDADDAVAFTGELVAFWESCPRQDHGDGYESVNDVRPTGAGGESYALLRWSEYDGSPGVGLTVVHVTRLGRSVLVDQASNEGSRAGAPAQVAGQIAAADPIVAAMCRFTLAGC